jgi:cytochrome c-type biogenesis protein CcmH/NrfF
MTLPLAHIGHYLWILYLLPVLFVIAGILKTTLSEKRRNEEGDSDED